MRYSIIIPLYNASDTIEKCLRSILIRNYSDLEILCIDDGSVDNTLSIVKRFRDDRIKLFETSHAGVSTARNMGIKQAKGEYLLFCDSDDEYIEDIFSLLDKEESDVILFGAEIVNCNKKYHLNDIIFNDCRYSEGINRLFFKKEGIWPYVWHGAYKRKMIIQNDICFDKNISLGEDLCFQLAVFLVAKTVAFNSNMGYKYYHCRPDSSELKFLREPVERIKRHIMIINACYDLYNRYNLFPQDDFYVFTFNFINRDVISLEENQKRTICKMIRKMNKKIETIKRCKDPKAKIKMMILGYHFLLNMYERRLCSHE